MKNVIAVLLFFSASSSICATNDDGYEYRDCKSFVYGIPTGSCKYLTTSKDFLNIHISDVFEERDTKKTKPPLLSTGSKILPISIPKENYEKTNSWEDGEFSYIKVAKNINDFPLSNTVDVIAVVPKSFGMHHHVLAEKIHEFDVMQNAAIAFSYSKIRGVIAISIMAPKSSSEVYYCASKKCIFSPEQ